LLAFGVHWKDTEINSSLRVGVGVGVGVDRLQLDATFTIYPPAQLTCFALPLPLFIASAKPLWHMMIATSILMYTQNYIFNKGKWLLRNPLFLFETTTKIPANELCYIFFPRK